MGLTERFQKIQKLLKLVKELPNKVMWEPKRYVPVYRRNKKPIDVKDEQFRDA